MSNRIITDKTMESGTWLSAISLGLVQRSSIELANISTGRVPEIERCDYLNIRQWAVPIEKMQSNGLPSSKTIRSIQLIVKEYAPDIIQVWGTENYWGLLTARGILPGRHILNIQGLLSTISPVFYGGLTNYELLRCYGIKEILRPSLSLFAIKKQFDRAIIYEEEIIKGHQYIIAQSEWTKANIMTINPNHISFKTERVLRQEFSNCESWNELNYQAPPTPILFTLATVYPYKGLHILIRSLVILRNKFPNIQLKIAGYFTKPGIRRSGYDRWLLKLIRQNSLINNVQWLGPISSTDLIANLQRSSVFVNPSFIETYSLTLAEAMYVGTPSVVSYAGAMPELAEHEISALFFNPGDHYGCATQIARFLNDFYLSKKVSKEARTRGLERNNQAEIINNQINIYRAIR